MLTKHYLEFQGFLLILSCIRLKKLSTKQNHGYINSIFGFAIETITNDLIATMDHTSYVHYIHSFLCLHTPRRVPPFWPILRCSIHWAWPHDFVPIPPCVNKLFGLATKRCLGRISPHSLNWSVLVLTPAIVPPNYHRYGIVRHQPPGVSQTLTSLVQVRVNCVYNRGDGKI